MTAVGCASLGRWSWWAGTVVLVVLGGPKERALLAVLAVRE